MNSVIALHRSNSPIAFYVNENQFEDSVLDMSWSKDGYKLLACSRNGQVVQLTFTEEELGKALTVEEMRNYLKSQYGDFTSMSTILESPITTRISPLSDEALKHLASRMSIPQPLPPPQGQYQPRIMASTSSSAKQNIAITKDGRKRIAPTLITASPAPEYHIQQQHSPTIDLDIGNDDADIEMIDELDRSRSSVLPPAPSVDVLQKGKRKISATVDQMESIRYAKRARHDNHNDAETDGGDQTERSVEYVRKINENDELVCSEDGYITYKSSGRKKWMTFMGERPILVVGNENFIAAACASNALHIFSVHGRRLFPPLILDARAFIMNCSKQHHLVVLTEDRTLSLWDISRERCLTPPKLSIDELESRYDQSSQVRVDDVRVNEKGIAVVTLSNGESYSYHQNMQSWFCVASAHTALAPTIPTLPHIYGRSRLSKEPLSLDVLKARAKEGQTEPVDGMRNMGKHIKEDMEMSIAAAIAIGDKLCYLHTIVNYVRHLASQNDMATLRDLFRSLLGPTSLKSNSDNSGIAPNQQASETWDHMVIDLYKRQVLHHILTAIQTYPSVQRLVNEFRSQLDACITPSPRDNRRSLQQRL